MRINTNIAAMQANRSLALSNAKTEKSNQKLSSGYRINSAADDAAGMAVASKMKTQIRGLKMASRNSLDGISLIQTAEGALSEVQDMLQRIRELAIQSANDTLDSNDREAIQKEVDQLTEEIKSTTNLTEFNKIKLLNGDIDRRSFTNLNQVAKCVNVSDTVDPGTYKFTVAEKGYPAILTGDTVALQKTKETDAQGLSGRFSINDEEVKILETDTASMIFEKIRDLGERVGVKVTYTPASNGSSFLTASNLNFETIDSGSDKSISIYANDSDLLKALGITNTDPENPITGTDAVVKLVVGGGESKAAVVTGAAIPPSEDINGKITINGKSIDINILKSDTQKATLDKLNADFESAGVKVTASIDSTGKLQLTSNDSGAHVEMTLSGDLAGSTAIANSLNIDNALQTDRTDATSATPAVLELDLPEVAGANGVSGTFELTVNGTSKNITLNVDNGDSVVDALNLALANAGLANVVASVSSGGKIELTATTTDGSAATITTAPSSTSIYSALGIPSAPSYTSYKLGDSSTGADNPWDNVTGLWDGGAVNKDLSLTIDGVSTLFTLNITVDATKNDVKAAINSALETAFGSNAPVEAIIDGDGDVTIQSKNGLTFVIEASSNDGSEKTLGFPDSTSVPTTTELLGLTFTASILDTSFNGSVKVADKVVELELTAGLTEQGVVDAINSALLTAGVSPSDATASLNGNGNIELSCLPALVSEPDLGLTPETSSGTAESLPVSASTELDIKAFLADPKSLEGKLTINLSDNAVPPNIESYILDISLSETDDTDTKVMNKIKAAIDQEVLKGATGLADVTVTALGGSGGIKIESASAYTVSLEQTSSDETLNALGFTAQTIRGKGGISDFSETATVNCSGNRVIITDSNYQKMIIEIPLSDNERESNKNIYTTSSTSSSYLGTINNPTEQNKMDSELITLTVLDAGPLQLQVGPNENMRLELQVPELSAAALGIEFMNLRTVKGASKAITMCDDAISMISNLRSKLGAYQNRLEHTIANLETTEINTSAALSRIQDTDMADEMSKFTQQNVISQAGISMLAQANQLPQQLMKLLQ